MLKEYSLGFGRLYYVFYFREGMYMTNWLQKIGIFVISLYFILSFSTTIFAVDNHRNSNHPPIFQMIEEGDIETLREVLDAGADPNQQVDGGWTPLMEAVIHEKNDVLKVLLEYDADTELKIQDISKAKIFLHIVDPDDCQICRENAVANPSLKERASGYYNVYVKKEFPAGFGCFICNGFFVEKLAQSRVFNGMTALALAVYAGHIDIVTTLLNHGADIHVKNTYNTSLLHILIFSSISTPFYNSIDDVKAMLNLLRQYKMNIREIDENGALLHFAQFWGSKDAYGHGLLHFAAFWGADFQIMKLLVKLGADINARDPQGKTPILIALQSGNLRTAASLFELGGQIGNDYEALRLLLKNNNERDKLELLRLFFERGLNPNIKSSDGRFIPFFAECVSGSDAVVRLFLTYGANPSIKNSAGEVPLTVVDDSTKAKILIQAGATVAGVKNKHHLDLVHIANKIKESPKEL